MRCKCCKEKFEPKYFNQKYCMEKDECIKAFLETIREKQKKEEAKKWNAKKKEMKESIKSHSDLLNDLQEVVNEFVRLRDKNQPCISCGTMNDVKYDAGHYYSRKGYSGIRFDEDNIHKQCSNNCNMHLSGNFPEYTVQLPKRIGQERFNALVERRHIELKLTVPELKEKIAYYKSKIAEMKKLN